VSKVGNRKLSVSCSFLSDFKLDLVLTFYGNNYTYYTYYTFISEYLMTAVVNLDDRNDGCRLRRLECIVCIVCLQQSTISKLYSQYSVLHAACPAIASFILF
jgi:hypothetical protein